MTNLSPPLIYDRDSTASDRVDLVVVETVDDARVQRVWELQPDKAISLGLGLAVRGWRAKMAGRP